MNLPALEALVEGLTIADIRAIAGDLAVVHSTAAEEIAAMRATLTVEHELRRNRRHTQAAVAAHSVTAAVQEAARRERVRLPDDAVTKVARAVAQVARALVAGEQCAAEAACLARGLHRIGDFERAPAFR